MAVYATADELASALRIAVTVKNQDDLTACVVAASQEIDQYCDRPASNPMPDPVPALVNRECIARGVEHWKAADMAGGAIGFDGTGVLAAPVDGFARHARNLIAFKVGFGVG